MVVLKIKKDLIKNTGPEIRKLVNQIKNDTGPLVSAKIVNC